jgi:hypothetical protein
MEVQWKKHVRVICDLELGDKVTTDEWGGKLDNKVHEVEDVFYRPGTCESGFMIKISGYGSPIDSNWLNKIPKENG